MWFNNKKKEGFKMKNKKRKFKNWAVYGLFYLEIIMVLVALLVH